MVKIKIVKLRSTNNVMVCLRFKDDGDFIYFSKRDYGSVGAAIQAAREYKPLREL